ncbi:NGG1p interacting factor NIF3 [Thiomicrorhabdus indica]|uniref:NGG1p interacting factor NIF3 n=1 Tax=Thiomicrorhabdus indica TaxID=2267253 RepID=UPI00102D8968|nr:NGG1p interacting factor NIF3 [Thiomicrorhabdus indica]
MSQSTFTHSELFQLFFYVPESHLESVKQAVFMAGAGKIGNYEGCAWQVAGTGQFRPIEGSQPFIGEQGTLEKVKEFRVEMVFEPSTAEQVLKALKQAHPYETPAYGVLQLANHLYE